MDQLFLKSVSECLSRSFLTAAVLFRKGFMWHNNYVKLSQLCGDTAYRNGFECASETQPVTFSFPAAFSKGAAMGGR